MTTLNAYQCRDAVYRGLYQYGDVDFSFQSSKKLARQIALIRTPLSEPPARMRWYRLYARQTPRLLTHSRPMRN